MIASRKWLCGLSLFFGGLLSLLLSILGFSGLVWPGFAPTLPFPFTLALLLPYLLAFPLFVFAVAFSKRGSLVLWIVTPFPGLAPLVFLIHGQNGSAVNVLRLLARNASSVLPLLALAALVQFGTRFYEFTHDSKWVRWKKDNLEPAA
jgi:hypothetical protein